MGTGMKQRRGTAAEWTAANPVLEEGELGIEEDTEIIKVGDGVTAWLDLDIHYVPKNQLDAEYYGAFIAFATLDAIGDLLVGTGPDGVARLPMGTPGQQLKVKNDGTGLFWETPPATDLSSRIPWAIFEAAGDLIVGTGVGLADNLPPGTAGQVLTIVAGVPTWVTPSGGSSVGFAELFLHGGG